MKRWIMAALVAVSSAALADNAAIVEQLKQLQEQVLLQQKQIEALQQQLVATPAVSQEEVSRMVEAEVQGQVDAQGLAQMKDVGSLLTLGDGIDGLKLTGDLRLRWGTLFLDRAGNLPDVDPDALMTRFRLGLVWTNSDGNWEVGAGLATGMNSAGWGGFGGFGGFGGASAAQSTDDPWSFGGAFETGDIYLDYAYAKHSWQESGVSLILGQQKNPFVSSWLLWDTDVRPAGATVEFESAGIFATAGVYDVMQYVRFGSGDADMGALYAGQVGYDWDCEGFDFLLAAAYYHFNGNSNKTLARVGPLGVAPLAAPVSSSYEYRIGDLYAEGSIPVGDAEVSFYGDLFKNFGADGPRGTGQQGGTLDPGSEDMGWVLGAGVTLGRFSLGYAYAEVEADSLVALLSDLAFGFGVGGFGFPASDIRGHVINLDYQLTDNCSLGFEADIYEALERSNLAEAEMYMLDLNYKF